MDIHSKYELVIENENDTLLNLVNYLLNEDEMIEAANYNKHHPLDSSTYFRIQFKDDDLQCGENMINKFKEKLVDVQNKCASLLEQIKDF